MRGVPIEKVLTKKSQKMSQILFVQIKFIHWKKRNCVVTFFVGFSRFRLARTFDDNSRKYLTENTLKEKGLT